MITEKSKTFRYFFFGALYGVQGIIVAFTSNFAKPYLSGFGVDPDKIGLLATLLLIPFIFKIFYGMLSDKVNLFGRGHRLPYISIALLLSAAGIAAAGFIHPKNDFTLYAICILLTSFAVALFDTTADALAVEITPVEEQGRVQSVMTSGRAIGIIIMSLVIGWLATSWGYLSVFLIIALCFLLPLAVVMPAKEPPRSTDQPQFSWRAFAALLNPRYLIFALYGILSWISYQGTEGLVTLFMSEKLNAIEAQIGTYGALKGVGAVLGALFAAYLLRRLGRKGAAFLVAGAVSIGALLFSIAGNVNVVLGLAIVWGVVLGLHWTIYMVLAMNRTDARIVGSMFAISMAVSNIGSAIGEGVATGLTDNMSFSRIFMLLAIINLAVFPILWGVFRLSPAEDAK